MMRRIRVLNITLSFCLLLLAAGCGLGDDPECLINEDCDDGVDCNGYETCVLTICEDGDVHEDFQCESGQTCDVSSGLCI